MNQTFSGAILLAAVLLIAAILFAIALVMKPKAAVSKRNKTAKNKPDLNTGKSTFNSKAGAFGKASNAQLMKLKNQISKNFPDFNALMRDHHLVLERNAKKVALLTLDVNAALGRRRLGEVTVINFHQVPSVEELRIEQSGV